MKKQILAMAIVPVLVGALVSTSAYARGGGGEGDCTYCGEDSSYTGLTDAPENDRSEEARSAAQRAGGCDFEQDYMVNNVCFDGRL